MRTQTFDEVLAELDAFADNHHRTRIAVVLPPERVISHDDQEPEVRHQFLIAGYRELAEMARRSPRARFTTIGAVVFPCTWEPPTYVPRHILKREGDQPWILIKPEFMGDPNILDLFREAAAADREWWSTEGKANSLEMMEEDAIEEDARRTKARKAAATRKRNAKTVQKTTRSA